MRIDKTFTFTNLYCNKYQLRSFLFRGLVPYYRLRWNQLWLTTNPFSIFLSDKCGMCAKRNQKPPTTVFNIQLRFLRYLYKSPRDISQTFDCRRNCDSSKWIVKSVDGVIFFNEEKSFEKKELRRAVRITQNHKKPRSERISALSNMGIIHTFWFLQPHNL